MLSVNESLFLAQLHTHTSTLLKAVLDKLPIVLAEQLVKARERLCQGTSKLLNRWLHRVNETFAFWNVWRGQMKTKDTSCSSHSQTKTPASQLVEVGTRFPEKSKHIPRILGDTWQNMAFHVHRVERILVPGRQGEAVAILLVTNSVEGRSAGLKIPVCIYCVSCNFSFVICPPARSDQNPYLHSGPEEPHAHPLATHYNTHLTSGWLRKQNRTRHRTPMAQGAMLSLPFSLHRACARTPSLAEQGNNLVWLYCVVSLCPTLLSTFPRYLISFREPRDARASWLLAQFHHRRNVLQVKMLCLQLSKGSMPTTSKEP